MSTPSNKKGGQGHERESQLGLLTGTPSRATVPPGMAPAIQALRQVTGRLLNLLLDEFLDRPTPPGPLWPTKGKHMSVYLCHLGSDEARDCPRCGVKIYGLGCGDHRQCALYQRARAERAEQVLADIVMKAAPYGVQDGEFIAAYILPTGPMHRAIPLLAEQGVHVRPMGEPPEADA